ncbi:MAG: SgcJ/EcaC family oxidoreductase [bacterium]
MTATLSRQDVISLFTRLLQAWNARDADAFAAQFAEHGSTVGFDGSPLDGRAAIAKELGGIFKDHPTAAYVARVREVRDLGGGVALLRAVASMVPPGKSELMPERNAMQSLIAVVDGGAPKIALFQNTPAKFDGRPQLTQQLTEELTDVLRSKREVDAG